MKRIATISTRALAPIFKEYLPGCRDSQKLIAGAGLHPNCMTDEDMLVPQFAVWQLGRLISEAEGSPFFLYELVMESKFPPIPPSLMHYFGDADDHLLLACHFVELLNNFTPETRFWWEIEQNEFLFRRQPRDSSEAEGLCVEVYALAAFMRFMRDHVSNKTKISKAYFRSRLPDVKLPVDIRNARVFQGREYTGVSLPLKDIATWDLHVASGNDADSADLTPRIITPEEELYQLRLVIQQYLQFSKHNINNVAAALGLSSRTLQRKLYERGLKYSTLVEDVRMETARRYLKRSPLTVVAIARKLGYQHAGDLTRAFTRHEGMTPTQYRKSLISASIHHV